MQRAILRLASFAVGLYYRQERLGAEVPEQGPLLLVANHPNGLVDPIVLARTTSRPVRFLGKATLFEMPVIGTLMRGLQAVPVHRPQDAGGVVDNTATFAEVHAALSAGQVVCLFPEGTSHDAPELRKLKTGAARMALQVAPELGLRIVPIGLLYRAKRRFRSSVATWIGLPIDVRDLSARHLADPRAAVAELTERIAAGLRQVTLDLERWEDLPLLELAERIWRRDAARPLERLRVLSAGLRELRRRDPERLDRLVERVSALGERLQRLGVPIEDLERRYRPGGVLRFCLRNGLLLLLGLPGALAGTLLWWLPYRLVPLVTRLVRPSRDVHATVQILAGAVLFPLWLLLLVAALAEWLGAGPALALLVLAPALGLFTLAFRDWRAEIAEDVAVFLRLSRRAGLRARLLRERDAIAGQLDLLQAELAAVPTRSGTEPSR